MYTNDNFLFQKEDRNKTWKLYNNERMKLYRTIVELYPITGFFMDA